MKNMKHKTISRQHINSIKVEKGCAICGYNKLARALDFHHLMGEKKGNISQLWGKEMFREAMKCIILCSNCHRELHAGMHSLKPLYKKLLTQKDLGYIKDEWSNKRLSLYRQQAVDDARKANALKKNGESRKVVAMKLYNSC